uniref:Uncharacterized protein n=1 Tax=Arundo donax TaxID=35708 RepID=A0A0A9BQZ7_ARUDO
MLQMGISIYRSKCPYLFVWK